MALNCMREESNKLRACKAGSNEGYGIGHNSLLHEILIALASKSTMEPASDRKALSGTDGLWSSTSWFSLFS